MPSREELARALQRLAVTRTPIEGASDHGISEAIYLPDPDGNGIELAADRPREAWPTLETLGRPNPLDLYGLLGTLGDAEPVRHADAGTIVGHVHLHVNDIAAARRFYEDVVGFDADDRACRTRSSCRSPATTTTSASTPGAASASRAPRRRTASPGCGTGRSSSTAPTELAAARGRLEAAGVGIADRDGGLLVHDPAGIPVLLALDPR